VAIRDRIRCYYKSYVQTARKRGLLLPSTTTGAPEYGDDTAPVAAEEEEEGAEDVVEEVNEAVAPKVPVPAEAEVRE
jgi:hypothetical protein